LDGWLRYSASFTDGAKLLAAAERMGLEGVMSKTWVMPYRCASPVVRNVPRGRNHYRSLRGGAC